MSDSNQSFKIFGMIIILAILAIGIYYFVSNKSAPAKSVDHFANAKKMEEAEEKMTKKEKFQNETESADEEQEEEETTETSEEGFQNQMQQQPSGNQLTAGDLLPNDNSSQWAQVYPQGEGSLKDRNFLQAGYHIGINTVGQTLRNANLQLRSEPPAPQVKVSPWLQSTIEPDLGRKPFEIGGCA